MFCKFCGTQLPANVTFCHICGANILEENAKPEEQPVEEPVVETPPPSVPSTNILVFGILGLCFALTAVLSLLGLIFGRVAMDKARDYRQTMGDYNKKAKAGRVLGILGFTFGLILSILVSIAVTVGIIAILTVPDLIFY